MSVLTRARQKPTALPQELLTPQEFADAVRWKLATVYSKVSRRELPAVHIGRSLRFRRSDVEKLIRAGLRPALHPRHETESSTTEGGAI
jgi:excisionase family DNA binding protein